MPKTFAEIIADIREIAGETVSEETFTELQTAYDEDLSVRDAAVTAREQAIADHQKDIAARDAEVLRLKAVNYDLIKAVPKAGEPDKDNKPDAGTEKQGVDSLFE